MIVAARDHLKTALQRLDAAARAVYDEDDVFTTKTEANVGARIERDQALGIALDRSQEALSGEHVPVVGTDMTTIERERDELRAALRGAHGAGMAEKARADALDAEVMRLQGDVAELRAKDHRECVARAAELEAALREIAEMDDGDAGPAVAVASQALAAPASPATADPASLMTQPICTSCGMYDGTLCPTHAKSVNLDSHKEKP